MLKLFLFFWLMVTIYEITSFGVSNEPSIIHALASNQPTSPFYSTYSASSTNVNFRDKQPKESSDAMKLNAFVTPTTRTDCFNSINSLYSQVAMNNGIDGAKSYFNIRGRTPMINNASYASGTYTSFLFRHAWLYTYSCSNNSLQFYFGTKGVSKIEGCYEEGSCTKVGSANWYLDWTYSTYVQPGCTLFYATYDDVLGYCSRLPSSGVDGAAVVGAVWGEGTLPPTSTPTSTPSIQPSRPTITPTVVPTSTPSITPTFNPSSEPSLTPTNIPSSTPSSIPTSIPSYFPSNEPTLNPTTSIPTSIPSYVPSKEPTLNPTTHAPILTLSPTDQSTVAPSIAAGTSAKSIQSDQNGVIVGVATVVAIIAACCLLILVLLYRRRSKKSKTKEPVGTQDLKIWIQQDEESNNTLNLVKVADWKKNQLVAIGEGLYLTPRSDTVNDKGLHNGDNNKDFACFSNNSLESNRGGGGNRSTSKTNSMNNNQMSNKDVEVLHSIQQQLQSLSGVNPLSVQTAGFVGDCHIPSSGVGGSGVRNPLTGGTHSTANSSPTNSPTRGSTILGSFITNIASRNSSPERTSKDLTSPGVNSTNNPPNNGSSPFRDVAMPSFRSSILGILPHRKPSTTTPPPPDKTAIMVSSSSNTTTTNDNSSGDDMNRQEEGGGGHDDGNDAESTDTGRPSFSLDMGSVYKNENDNQII